MQDLRTGEMKMLDPEAFKRDPQAAMDAVAPRKYQGPVLRIGEILDIKGGKFQVMDIKTRGRLILKGVPA